VLERVGVTTLAKCEICGKITAFGNNVSHSKRHTKRMFRPNLQKTAVYEGGQKRRMVACTKCLKRMRIS
jgi:large subunit ribosomal protein L28